jgi:hypothetical protein
MGDGKHCPACGADIGVWRVFSAGWPDRIRCPRCKARLGYRGIGPLVIVGLLALGAVVAAAYAVAMSFEVNRQLVAFGAVLLGAWVLVELAATWYLRANKVLEFRSGGAPPGDKEDT